MKISILSASTLLAVLMVIIYSPAYGHKVRTFAYESGGEIITETVFSSGRPAINTTIKVMTKAGELVLTGKTDAEGIFSFTIPQQAREQQLDLNIIADVGEGHQGSWQLNAADYLPRAAEKTGQTTVSTASTSPPIEEVPDRTLQYEADCSELEKRLETLIVRELSPIKRQLAEQHTEKTSLRDILSGLGYIFGLAGIILYYQSRKTRSQK